MVTFKMIRGRSGVFAFDGEVVGSTDKAIKVAVNNGILWLPKKAVETDYTIKQWFGLSPAQMALVEPVSRFYNGADGKAELPPVPASESVDIAELVRQQIEAMESAQ